MTGRRMESNLEKSTISEHDVNLDNHDRRWPPLAEKALLTSCSAWRYLSNGDVEIGMAPAAVGGEQKRCDLQRKFVIAAVGVNSDEAVGSTNRLKAFILKAFHGLLNSLKRAVIKAKELISKALDHLVKREEALSLFEAFQKLLFFLVALLFAIIDVHFSSSDISPLETHHAIFLLFLGAIFVYGLAYVLIAVQTRDSEYLSELRFICLVFGTLAMELPTLIIISPFWLFMVNLCSILIIGVLCLYKQISQFVCQIYGKFVQRFQSAAFQGERGDNNNQVGEIV